MSAIQYAGRQLGIRRHDLVSVENCIGLVEMGFRFLLTSSSAYRCVKRKRYNCGVGQFFFFGEGPILLVLYFAVLYVRVYDITVYYGRYSKKARQRKAGGKNKNRHFV